MSSVNLSDGISSRELEILSRMDEAEREALIEDYLDDPNITPEKREEIIAKLKADIEKVISEYEEQSDELSDYNRENGRYMSRADRQEAREILRDLDDTIKSLEHVSDDIDDVDSELSKRFIDGSEGNDVSLSDYQTSEDGGTNYVITTGTPASADPFSEISGNSSSQEDDLEVKQTVTINVEPGDKIECEGSANGVTIFKITKPDGTVARVEVKGNLDHLNIVINGGVNSTEEAQYVIERWPEEVLKVTHYGNNSKSLYEVAHGTDEFNDVVDNFDSTWAKVVRDEGVGMYGDIPTDAEAKKLYKELLAKLYASDGQDLNKVWDEIIKMMKDKGLDDMEVSLMVQALVMGLAQNDPEGFAKLAQPLLTFLKNLILKPTDAYEGAPSASALAALFALGEPVDSYLPTATPVTDSNGAITDTTYTSNSKASYETLLKAIALTEETLGSSSTIDFSSQKKILKDAIAQDKTGNTSHGETPETPVNPLDEPVSLTGDDFSAMTGYINSVANSIDQRGDSVSVDDVKGTLTLFKNQLEELLASNGGSINARDIIKLIMDTLNLTTTDAVNDMAGAIFWLLHLSNPTLLKDLLKDPTFKRQIFEAMYIDPSDGDISPFWARTYKGGESAPDKVILETYFEEYKSEWGLAGAGIA